MPRGITADWAAWDPTPSTSHDPPVAVLLGCRPLGTYTAEPEPSGRTDCPCGGSIPRGHDIYCAVCHRSGHDHWLDRDLGHELARWHGQRHGPELPPFAERMHAIRP